MNKWAWLGTLAVGENHIKSLTFDREHTELYAGLFPVHDGESRHSSFRPTKDRFEVSSHRKRSILRLCFRLTTFRIIDPRDQV